LTTDADAEPSLAEHLNALRKQNQGDRSIHERRLAVLRVARYLGHPVADVTREELVAWQDERSGDLSPAGMHNELVHVSQFLKWLGKEGRRQDDPSLALIRPRHVHQRLPRPIHDGGVQLALSMAPQPLHAWLGLGAFCGLRCSEIAKVRREDIIDGPPAHIRVIGKGGKERVVPMPSNLLAELTGPEFPDSGHLFGRMDGKPGPPSAARVSERLNDHLHALGLRDTAHALRHRFGTKFYAATEDPILVAEVMGHASVDTTRGYVLVNVLRAAAPVEEISTLSA
jgi:integrase